MNNYISIQSLALQSITKMSVSPIFIRRLKAINQNVRMLKADSYPVPPCALSVREMGLGLVEITILYDEVSGLQFIWEQVECVAISEKISMTIVEQRETRYNKKSIILVRYEVYA